MIVTKYFLNRISAQNVNILRTLCSYHNQQNINVDFINGLPQFRIPLPSRHEECLFVMSPLSQNVGDLVNNIKNEDGGIDRIAFYNTDGLRISKSNSIYSLLSTDFNLVINDVTYTVNKPDIALTSTETIDRLSEVKNLISQLNIAVHSEQYQLEKDNKLKESEEEILRQLEPLENKRMEIAEASAKHTRRLTWLGLGGMGLQFGLLARLTWWEYSWDIMEPVTYFVGYGTAIAMYAYYVVTRQEYAFPQVFDRQYLKKFYKVADKNQFDIEIYNKLREDLSIVQSDRRRLRDPLLLNLPLQQLGAKLTTSENSPDVKINHKTTSSSTKDDE